MERQLALVMVPLLALMALPAVPMAAAAKEFQTPRYECEFQCPAIANFIFNDTDGDGLDEIFCYADKFIRCMDPPGYETVLSVDDAVNGRFPYVKDLDGNGTIGIILAHSNPEHYNLSIYSGKDFGELWRSPDINGTASSPQVKDVDGDGQLELVWVDQYLGLSRIIVYGAMSHELEWAGQPFPERDMISEMTVQNLDSDPAMELLVGIRDNQYGGFDSASVHVYDGHDHALQWELNRSSDFTFGLLSRSPEDYDGDGFPEMLVQYSENGTNGTMYGLRLYTAANGSIEWDLPLQKWPSTIITCEDGTGAMNLFLQNRTGDYPNVYNYTCDVFSLQNHSLIWQAGPWAQNDTYNSYIDAYDFNGDGRDEIIIRNSTAEREGSSSVFSGGTWELLNGSDFTHLWTSPMLEGYADVQLSPYGAENESYFVLVSNPKDGENGSTNCTVTIVSASNYSMIWRSEKYPGNVEAQVGDYVGDSAYEILVSVQYQDGRGHVSYLYEMVNFSLIWTSPPSRSGGFPFGIFGAPLVGPDRNELLFVNYSSQTIHTEQSTNTYSVSTITIYDNTTLEQLWTSDILPGSWWIRTIWDFDNDSNMEVLFTSEDYRATPSGSVAILEFPRDRQWPVGIDSGPPSVRIKNPANGSRIQLNVNITGDAQDDRLVDAVMVRIDNGSWLDAVKRYPGRNDSCNWTFFWNISGLGNGTHTIYARSFDGLSWSPTVSVNVTILLVIPEPPGGNGTGRPSESSGDEFWPLCLAGAVMILVLAALVLRTRPA